MVYINLTKFNIFVGMKNVTLILFFLMTLIGCKSENSIKHQKFTFKGFDEEISIDYFTYDGDAYFFKSSVGMIKIPENFINSINCDIVFHQPIQKGKEVFILCAEEDGRHFYFLCGDEGLEPLALSYKPLTHIRIGSKYNEVGSTDTFYKFDISYRIGDKEIIKSFIYAIDEGICRIDKDVTTHLEKVIDNDVIRE